MHFAASSGLTGWLEAAVVGRWWFRPTGGA